MKTYQSEKEKLIASPCTRYKLKAVIEAFDALDPVDALHDAATLAALMETRVNEMQNRAPRVTDGLNEAGKFYYGKGR